MKGILERVYKWISVVNLIWKPKAVVIEIRTESEISFVLERIKKNNEGTRSLFMMQNRSIWENKTYCKSAATLLIRKLMN